MLNKTNVRIGTRVGLAVLATDRSLHLYVDGTERGVVAPDVPDPCYFMFDLRVCVRVRASERERDRQTDKEREKVRERERATVRERTNV